MGHSRADGSATRGTGDDQQHRGDNAGGSPGGGSLGGGHAAGSVGAEGVADVAVHNSMGDIPGDGVGDSRADGSATRGAVDDQQQRGNDAGRSPGDGDAAGVVGTEGGSADAVDNSQRGVPGIVTTHESPPRLDDPSIDLSSLWTYNSRHTFGTMIQGFQGSVDTFTVPRDTNRGGKGDINGPPDDLSPDHRDLAPPPPDKINQLDVSGRSVGGHQQHQVGAAADTAARQHGTDSRAAAPPIPALPPNDHQAVGTPPPSRSNPCGVRWSGTTRRRQLCSRPAHPSCPSKRSPATTKATTTRQSSAA